jgi:phosphatidylinositol alpha-1,6-mannosyltransferase
MPTNNARVSVLGLFPQFGEGHFGGIQASASIAWQAVSERSNAELLVYSKNNGARHAKVGENNSRLRAIRKAHHRKNATDILLIWQLGLIKLLPFLHHDTGRIALFLHGIEAWKSQDWLNRRLSRRVDLFLSNSDYTWVRFISHNPELSGASHRTVPLGIGEPRLSLVPPPRARATALMLSRLSRAEDYKGHREVIAAWPLVLRLRPDAELWIAGTGDLQSELEHMVSTRGLAGSVRFLGVVSEEHKQKLLQQSRCLLMPSRGEGFGLVYLEAMRLGRPCLVSNEDAGREVVRPPEAGLSVDPRDGEGLSTAISRLLSDGAEWQQWSESARARYERDYTARQFQQRLADALFGKSEPTNV